LIGYPIKTAQGRYRHLAVDETVSTNTLCLEYAASGEHGDLWITADHQNAGKGSRGRQWESQKGNLFASLLISDPCEKSRLADVTFIACISVCEAIERFNVADATVQVKWPNDVLLNGRKCCGILLESVHYQTVSYVAMGIGVNCLHFPDQTLHKATSLFAEGIEVSADRFFLTLANMVADNISLWNKGKNFAAIRQKWLQNAYGIGLSTVVHIPGHEEIEGIFSSIDEDGYLLLETNGTTRRIATADVFFKRDP